MDPKSEIKSRLSIEELVGAYCQLHRKGRNFVCLCPFHNDSHPSLLVSPDKGIAYCFACSTGGDIFSFYQAIEKVDFPTAVKDLAERTGVELPKEIHKGPRKDERERIRECLNAALSFYRQRLELSNVAKTYLTNRGVDDALAKKFNVGYAPDSFTETYDHLLKLGYSKSEIIAAGLGVQRDLSDGGVYDRFRHRLMFPIEDHQGNLVGFGGRALKPDDAKYVNSPEGPLYHKSSVMYGLSMAREALREKKNVLLVEGYFDVIAAHKAGISNVVAVSGTALTSDHAKLLKRYVETAILCLDQDRAGKDAAAKAFQILSRSGVQVNAVTIPAKDPDELVAKDPQALVTIVAEKSVPYIDLILAELRADNVRETPTGKRTSVERMAPLLDAIPAAVEREAYVAKLAGVLGVSEIALGEDLKRIAKREHTIGTSSPVTFEKTPFTRSELCIGLSLTYPAIRDVFTDLLPPENPELQNVYEATIRGTANLESLMESPIHETIKEKIGVLMLFCEENFSQWSESTARREMRKLSMATNREIIAIKQRMLIKKLKEAREAGRIDDELHLLTQYNQALKLAKMASQ